MWRSRVRTDMSPHILERDNMQSNPNREEKNIVERWDWDDCHGIVPVRASTKLCWRRLRRKRQKRILDKAIQDAILKA